MTASQLEFAMKDELSKSDREMARGNARLCRFHSAMAAMFRGQLDRAPKDELGCQSLKSD